MSRDSQLFINDARSFQRYGDHETAISLLSKASCLEDLSTLESANIEKLFCFSYRKLGNYDLALIHINKAISILSNTNISTDINLKRELGMCLMNKAVVYEEYGNDHLSLEYSLAALDIFESLNAMNAIHSDILINAYITIATLYCNLARHDLAKEYLLQSLSLFNAMGETKYLDVRYASVLNTLHEIEDINDED